MLVCCQAVACEAYPGFKVFRVFQRVPSDILSSCRAFQRFSLRCSLLIAFALHRVGLHTQYMLLALQWSFPACCLLVKYFAQLHLWCSKNSSQRSVVVHTLQCSQKPNGAPLLLRPVMNPVCIPLNYMSSILVNGLTLSQVVQSSACDFVCRVFFSMQTYL